ncbi:MAG: hypothetical protein EXR75_03805 [Myxococcales bacterium]|nr:hypothetical protein [Myxococcales bacterium]
MLRFDGYSAMFAFAGLVAIGCSLKDEEPHELFPSTLESSSVDTSPPGELAEGKEAAFGLKFPRGLFVEATFEDAVSAAGSLPLASVVNYIRARVDTKNIDTGPMKTVFNHATLKSDPKRIVQVEVTVIASSKVEVTVRDRTPRPPSAPGLSEREQWQRAGIGPDGKVLREVDE